jgi:hypothetical protein
MHIFLLDHGTSGDVFHCPFEQNWDSPCQLSGFRVHLCACLGACCCLGK